MIKEQFFALMKSPAGETGLTISDTLSCSPKEAFFLFEAGFNAASSKNQVITDASRESFEKRMADPQRNLTRNGDGYHNEFVQQEWTRFKDIWFTAMDSTYNYKKILEYNRLLDNIEKEYLEEKKEKENGIRNIDG
jgi:hypothetical protein